MRHTPGPWVPSHGMRAIISADDQIVADVRGIFKPPLTPKDRQHTAEEYQVGETEANARLIAAAPELYEKLAALSRYQGSLEQAALLLADLYPDESNELLDHVQEARALLLRIDGSEEQAPVAPNSLYSPITGMYHQRKPDGGYETAAEVYARVNKQEQEDD